MAAFKAPSLRVRRIAIGVMSVLALLLATRVLMLFLAVFAGFDPGQCSEGVSCVGALPRWALVRTVLVVAALGGASLSAWIVLRFPTLEGNVGSLAVGSLGMSFAVALLVMWGHPALNGYELVAFATIVAAALTGLSRLNRYFVPTPIPGEGPAAAPVRGPRGLALPILGTAAALLGILPFIAWLISPDAILRAPLGFNPQFRGATAATILHVATDLPGEGFWSSAAKTISYSLIALSATMSGALGILIAWVGRDRDETRPLAVFLTFFPLALGMDVLVEPYGHELFPFAPPQYLVGAGAALAWGILMMGLVRFACEFPAPITEDAVASYFHRKPSGSRWDEWGLRLDRRVSLSLLRHARSPVTVTFLVLGLVTVTLLWRGSVNALLAGTLAVLASLLLLRIGFGTGSEEGRRRILWIYGGLIAAFGVPAGVEVVLFALGPVIGDVNYALIMLGLTMAVPASMVIFVSALGVAVFYHGALDPRLAIRRTTVFGSVGVLFVSLFAGLGNLAEEWLGRGLGLPGGIGTVLSGGAIAAGLIPVKRRMDGFMNRILPVAAIAKAPTSTTAVLFSDLAGHTGADQNETLKMMSAFHKAADRVARENQGRLVRTVADEVLLEFANPHHAVHAARELQGEFHEAASREALPTPELRAGVHWGYVTRSEDGDLLGDTVNIASRIHGLAGAGQIVLSSAVVDLLGDEVDLEDLGERTLKNVPEPVRCYAVRI